MRLFYVMLAAVIGCYMVIRGIYRIWNRNVNVYDDPAQCKGIVIDFLMIVLGVFLLLPCVLFVLH